MRISVLRRWNRLYCFTIGKTIPKTDMIRTGMKHSPTKIRRMSGIFSVSAL